MAIIHCYNNNTFMHSIEVLRRSIFQKNIEEARRIVDESPSLLVKRFEKGRTLLFDIVETFKDQEVVELLPFLIEKGANINDEDINKRTVTFTVCAKGMIASLVTITRFNPLALYHQDRLGQTPLFSAVRKNQLNFIKSIKIPPDLIDTCDEVGGHSLIFYAAACKHDEMSCLLLKKGANPFLKDFCGQDIFSYTSKTPKFASKVRVMQQEERKRVRDEQYKQKKFRQNLQQTTENETLSEQTYQMKIIKNNQIRLASEKQQTEFLKLYEKLKNKEDQQARPIGLSIYSPNWRNIAIKIIDSCLDERASWWFEHTSRAKELLGDEAKGRNDLVDLHMVNAKLLHHVYRTPPEFLSDMGKIWEPYKEGKGPEIQIAKYARELKQHFFKSLETFGFFLQ